MSFNKNYRAKCHFCSIQDDIILKPGNSENALFGMDNITQLYYDDKNDRGLCPRGNFSLELVDSPYRLRKTLKDGEVVDTNKAIKECAEELKGLSEKNDNIAILIGGSHSLEEAYLIKELTGMLNSSLLGIFPFEDEALLTVKNDFSFNDIASADLIVSLGDIFSLSPTMAKPIIDARNKERGNRLIYIDIVKGRMTPFAESYIPDPGFMVYFLSTLLDYLKGNKKIKLEKTGIGLSSDSVENIASTLKDSENGWILFSNIYGHFRNPAVIIELLEEIAHETGNHFSVIPVGQNSLGIGRIVGGFNNSGIMDKLKGKDVEGLITLGAVPDELIPDFENLSKGLKLIISSSFLRNIRTPGYVFPSRFSFEKEGSVISLEEEMVTLGESIPGIGGTISDGVLISEIYRELTGNEVKAQVAKAEPLERKVERDISVPKFAEDEAFPFKLVGAGLPYHHGNGEITRRMSWNNEKGGPYLYMNPNDYIAHGSPDEVVIETPFNSIEIELVRMDENPFDIGEGVLVVPVHYPECRKLFGSNADESGNVSPGFLKARIK